MAVGTRPETGTGHWFETWLGGGADYSQVHAARDGDPPFQVRTIRRANPSFDHLPVLRDGLLAQRDKARKFPDVLASYRTYHLNAGTPDTGKHVLLSVTDWRRCEHAKLPERSGPVAWGVDPGGADAFSAIVAYWPRTGSVEGLQTIGGIPELVDRQRRCRACRGARRSASHGWSWTTRATSGWRWRRRLAGGGDPGRTWLRRWCSRSARATARGRR